MTWFGVKRTSAKRERTTCFALSALRFALKRGACRWPPAVFKKNLRNLRTFFPYSPVLRFPPGGVIGFRAERERTAREWRPVLRFALCALRLKALLLFCLACSPSLRPAPQTLTFSQIVELSHVLPADGAQSDGATMTRLVLPPDDRRELLIDLRRATHLDLPHAGQPLVSVEHMSPRDLVQAAVVLDMRDQVQDDPRYMVQVADIRAWEWRHRRIPAGALVLLATGWDRHWDEPERYFNRDERQVPVVPGFSTEAATWLVTQRQVQGLGSDTPAVMIPSRAATDDGKQTEQPVLLLSNLTGLDQLPATGTTVVIGALKVQAGTGSPAHVMAFVPCSR